MGKGNTDLELGLEGPFPVATGSLSQSFPGENARSWEALGEARPGQSSAEFCQLVQTGAPVP